MPTMIQLADGTIPVASDFNSNNNALNQAIGTGTAITGYTTGDTLYASASNTLNKLPIGKAGQMLEIAAGIPQWGARAGHLFGLALANNGADATNDIDIAIGEAASDDTTSAARVNMLLTSALTKQLDATWAVGTGAGMRASGAAIANTTYHIFLIMRPDTGVVDIAADTSATGANISANTDAAYTKKRRIGSILREAGSIVAFTQKGDYFRRNASVLDFNASNPGTSAVTRTLSVPTGINVVALFSGLLVINATTTYALFSDLAASDEAPGTQFRQLACLLASIGEQAAGDFEIMTNTSAQIRSRLSNSGADVAIQGCTYGWYDTRGRMA